MLFVPTMVSEHPELKARGIVPEITLKPVGPSAYPQLQDAELTLAFQHIAWRTLYKPGGIPPYVVKIVKEGSEEADIYTRFLRYDRASPNHSVPCDVVRTESQRSLLVMPSIGGFKEQAFSRWTVSQLLDCLHQLVEVCYHEPCRSFVVLTRWVIGSGILARSSYRAFRKSLCVLTSVYCSSPCSAGFADR